VDVESPGRSQAEATRVMGSYLRDVVRLNADSRNFRLMGPDETASNRLDNVFEATDRVWLEEIEPYDVHLARQGRVMEVLSEHLCQGWLEGYLLTGRHGLFSCYEAFVHIVDSMFNQHAKWLKVSRALSWRQPIASLNYLLTSHVWRQDHNGFSHQDPGFIEVVVNKKADIVRVYLAPDANCLLWIIDHCLRTYDRINVIVAGKQPAPQWLTMDEAVKHCDVGIGIWEWASNDPDGSDPDVVMACAGDVPTLETLAAVELLRQHLPALKDPRRERRRLDDAAVEGGASARDQRCRIRRHVHARSASHLCLSRLPGAYSSADLQAQQSCQHARAGIHRGRHDDHAIRYGRAEPARSLSLGHGRDRTRAGAGLQGRALEAASAR
jgi:xylulose-5-phosphate/fructose-6-phosphate phosphoketolase